MMRFVLLILFSTLLFGCSDKPKDADLALQEKSALNVLEEHSEASYQAPANGILDDEQVQMYIAVKKREIELAAAAAKKIEQREAKVAKPEQGSLGGMMEDLSALSDFASFVTADIRAAQELGYNTAEYEWVRDVIWEAAVANSNDYTVSKMRTMYLESIDALKKIQKTSEDKQHGQELQQAITDMEIEIENLDGQSSQHAKKSGQISSAAALAANRAILKKYDDDIDWIDAEMAKMDVYGPSR